MDIAKSTKPSRIHGKFTEGFVYEIYKTLCYKKSVKIELHAVGDIALVIHAIMVGIVVHFQLRIHTRW